MGKHRAIVHGTPWAYNKGCRCEFCTEAVALYRRANRREAGQPAQERWWPTDLGCGVCALHRRTGISLGLHVYKGVLHPVGSG